MYRNHAVAAVVAARNEAPFIDDVVDAMPAFVDRIYVVDDASEDDTRAVALGAAAGSPADEPAKWCPERRRLDSRVAETDQAGRVAVLSHDEQRGAGGAVKTGYLAALDGDADLVATVDGDGQMDPRRLDRFLDPLVDGDADYAKGTRLSRREHTAECPRSASLEIGYLDSRRESAVHGGRESDGAEQPPTIAHRNPNAYYTPSRTLARVASALGTCAGVRDALKLASRVFPGVGSHGSVLQPTAGFARRSSAREPGLRVGEV